MGRNALGVAELHIGVVRAQRRPVVVGAEIYVLRPVAHQRVIQGHRLYILPHSRQNILLRLLLVAAGYVVVQCVRQRNAAGEGNRHHVHVGHALQSVRHAVHHRLIVRGDALHIVVHLVSGVAHHIHAAGLIGLGVGGDGIGAGGLRGGHGRGGRHRHRVAVLPVLAGLGTVLAAVAVRILVAVGGGLLPLRRLVDHNVVPRRIRCFLPIEQVGEYGEHGDHQSGGGDQQQYGSASALPPFIARTHPTYSLMTALAVAVSLVTHSTTQVP